MSSHVALGDLTEGLNDWRNIQDVIRVTFHDLYETVQNQERRIHALQQDVAMKADRAAVEVSLSQKASVSELNEALVKTSESMSQKADVQELAKVMDITTESIEETRREIARKADSDEVAGEMRLKANVGEVNEALAQKANKQNVVTALHKKANRSDLEARLAQKVDAEELSSALATKADVEAVEAQLGSRAAQADVERIVGEAVDELRAGLAASLEEKASHAEVAKRATTTDVHAWLRTKADKSQVEERALSSTVREGLQAKVDRTDFVEWSSSVDSELRRHYSELERALTARTDELARASELLQKTLSVQAEDIARARSDVHELQSTTTPAIEVLRLLEGKVDTDVFQLAMQAKADISRADRLDEAGRDVAHSLEETALRLREEFEAHVVRLDEVIASEASTRAELGQGITDRMQRELDGVQAGIANLLSSKSDASRLDELERKLVGKSDVSDMCALLDMKANIEDVNRALAEVNRELDVKAPVGELRRTIEHQAFINESLCAEHAIGRWLWKSGRLRANGLVPWNVQAANTSVDNFIFEEDKSFIVVKPPGLYEISFGFFGRKRPTVQVLVNGEPVLSAINTPNSVVHHPPRSRHTANNITGLSLVEFVSLPPNARVSLGVSGADTPTTEGFMALKKL